MKPVGDPTLTEDAYLVAARLNGHMTEERFIQYNTLDVPSPWWKCVCCRRVMSLDFGRESTAFKRCGEAASG